MEQEAKLKLVYPFYQGLSSYLQIVIPFTKGPSGIGDIDAWLDAVDARCEVQHLRTYLLTNNVSPEVLRAVLRHYLEKGTAREDGKRDLLLVHYLAQAISHFSSEISCAEAARLLEPVLGPVAVTAPLPIAQLHQDLAQAAELRDLVERKVLQRVYQAHADYYQPTPEFLALFAWFGLMVRRTCVRLVRAELDRIETNCRDLRLLGVFELCGQVGGKEHREKLDSVEQKCARWRHPFPGKYTDDGWFREIVACKKLSEDALQKAKTEPEPMKMPEPVKPPEPASAVSRQASESSAAQVEPPRQRIVRLILEALQALRSSDFARIQIGKAAVMLSSAEIHAFRSPGEPTSSLLREIVTSRAELAEAARSSDRAELDRARAAAAELLATVRNTVEGMPEKNSEIGINLQSSARALERALAQNKSAAGA